MPTKQPKELWVLRTADAWHTSSTIALLAVCSSPDVACKLLKKYCKDQDIDKLSTEDWSNLLQDGQTQGRYDNFLLEPIKLDELI